MANCTDFPLIFCGNGPKWTKTIQTRFSLQKNWDIQGNLVWHRQSSLIRHKKNNKESVKGCKVRKIQISRQKLSPFDVLSQNAQSEEDYLCHRPIQKILFDAKFIKTKPHSQKLIHKNQFTNKLEQNRISVDNTCHVDHMHYFFGICADSTPG